MLGEVIFLPDQGFHARIKTRTSRTEVVAEVIAVGTSPTPPATPAWGVTVSRLRNLELQSVSAATVTALLQPLSGLVEVHTLAVPANGQLTLPFPCRAVHLGDAYVNELRTMPVTAQVEAAGMGRMKAISHAYVRLFQTAGLRVGPDLERMSDISPGNNELRSEETRELIEQSWTRDGQISFAQHLPLPATVAGVTIDVTFGD